MEKEGIDFYADWLASLDDDDFENERYTVTHEAEKIGMAEFEYIEKRNACEIEEHRRVFTRARAEHGNEEAEKYAGRVWGEDRQEHLA